MLGVYFLKTQRGYATGPRSPSGQDRRDGRWVREIALVLPELVPGQLQPERGGPGPGRLRAQRWNIPVLIERKQLTTTLAMGGGWGRVTRGWEVGVR